jgi:hypothetical protein
MPQTQNEPSLDSRILLDYLLDRCDENKRHRLRLGFSFRFLTYLALYPHKDLIEDYLETQYPHYTPLDRLRTYQRLLSEASGRESFELLDVPDMRAEALGLDPRICRQYLQAALEDGNELLASGEYRYTSIFLTMSWLGFRFDGATLNNFRDKFFGSMESPAETIGSALVVIQQALQVIDNSSLISHEGGM